MSFYHPKRYAPRRPRRQRTRRRPLPHCGVHGGYAPASCVGCGGGRLTSPARYCTSFEGSPTKAGVRRLRFHDLRHSFETMAVRQFPITDVQTWMGHADIATTRKYIHYAPQPEAAARLGALVSEQLGEVSELRRVS